ncbi:MAG: hypothetical protein IJX81_04165 [Clostridia bacterium]|nr:hypothetical protein [Clostridia bacterium]
MEFFTFYNSFFSAIFALKESAEWTDVIICAAVSLSIGIALFILQGIGLFVMAKNRGFSKKWMAFVPFLSIAYLGKLTGDCIVFGHKMKRAGLYVMIAQILVAVTTLAYAAVSTVLFVEYGEYLELSQYGYGYEWVGLPAEAEPLRKFIWVCDGAGGMIGLSGLFEVVYLLLLLVLMISFFRKYVPQQAMFFSLLTCFVPLLRYVFVFALRKRPAINYEDYLRRQREEYARRQNQYGPYGGYGQGSYGGYGYSQPQTPPRPAPRPPEDPFAEFGGEEKNKTEGEEKKAPSDDLFD